jgi:hypothetical protein
MYVSAVVYQLLWYKKKARICLVGKINTEQVTLKEIPVYVIEW